MTNRKSRKCSTSLTRTKTGEYFCLFLLLQEMWYRPKFQTLIQSQLKFHMWGNSFELVFQIIEKSFNRLKRFHTDMLRMEILPFLCWYLLWSWQRIYTKFKTKLTKYWQWIVRLLIRYRKQYWQNVHKLLYFLWQVYILCGVDKSDVWPWWTSLWRGGNHWKRDYDVGDDDYDDDDDEEAHAVPGFIIQAAPLLLLLKGPQLAIGETPKGQKLTKTIRVPPLVKNLWKLIMVTIWKLSKLSKNSQKFSKIVNNRQNC